MDSNHDEPETLREIAADAMLLLAVLGLLGIPVGLLLWWAIDAPWWTALAGAATMVAAYVVHQFAITERQSAKYEQLAATRQEGNTGWRSIAAIKWRRIPRQGHAAVRCGACDNEWSLPGSVLEDFRQANSTAGRMIRTGTELQTLGANQGPRRAGQLAAENVKCPSCGSIDPQIYAK